LCLTNLAGTLQSGDSFKLFNATNCTGGFTNITPAIPGLNLAWSTNGLATGTLSVIASPTPQPRVGVSLAGGNLVFRGSNGVPGWNYYVLASSNVTMPLSNWTRLATHVFDGSGNFSFTNGVPTNASRQFYLLQLP